MKEYTKPIVSQIHLVIDQAVLSSCKQSGATGGPLSGGVDCDYGTTNCIDCLVHGS